VSIPTEYLDIKILDDYQHFFGCKKKYSKAKFWKEFTITEDAEMINEK
jgi:hypothetical protein